MRRSVKTLLASVGLNALLAMPLMAQSVAEPVDPAGEALDAAAAVDELPEAIIVTATKRSSDVQDIPISISVLGGESLQSGGVQRLSDVVDTLPNVRLPDALNPGNIAIRGISSQARATARVEQPVGTYVDEVFVGSRFLDSFLYDIDRVEVLRGPQGTLWGRNTAAGAVSYITQRPTSTFQGYGEITYGNFDLLTLRGAVSGPVADEVAYRLAYGHLSRDGYEERLSGGTFGAIDSDSLRGQLRFEPSSDLDVTLIAEHSDTRSFPRSQIYISGPFASGGPGSRQGDTNDRGFTRGQRKRTGLTALANLQLGGHTLTSVTGYNRQSSFYRFDEDGSTNDFIVSFFGDRDEPETSRQFTQELRLASPSGDLLEYTLGAYYFSLEEFNKTTFSYGDFLAPLLAGDEDAFIYEEVVRSRQRTEAQALFGQFTLKPTAALDLVGGFRFNRERKIFRSDASQSRAFNLGGGLLFETPPGAYRRLAPFEDDVFTFMGGATYHWSPDVMTYATYSEGYKSGGFNTDALSDPTISPSFDPEQTRQYEAGLRSTLLDRRLTLNLTGFWLDYGDLQVEEYLGLRVQVGNAGSARSRGLELELTARPARGWRIGAALGWLDAEYRDFSLVAPDGTLVYDRAGNRLPFAPEVSGSVNVRRDFRTGFGDFFASGEWVFSSAYFTEPDNNPDGRQDAYHAFNARFGFASSDGRWELALWARNLTNRDVRVDFNDNLPGFFGGSIFEVLTPPRTYGVEARFNF